MKGGVSMKKELTPYGEIKFSWENSHHPDNPNFQQRVIWMAWQKKDGSFSLCYKLDYTGKAKFLYGEMATAILKSVGIK